MESINNPLVTVDLRSVNQGDIENIRDCRWAKPIHRAAITHTLNACLSLHLS